jgi:hypothetical protein
MYLVHCLRTMSLFEMSGIPLVGLFRLVGPFLFHVDQRGGRKHWHDILV